jgi:hypothetical protein
MVLTERKFISFLGLDFFGGFQTVNQSILFKFKSFLTTIKSLNILFFLFLSLLLHFNIHEFLNALIGESRDKCNTPLCFFICDNREQLLKNSAFLKGIYDDLVSKKVSKKDDENYFESYVIALISEIDIMSALGSLVVFFKNYTTQKSLENILTAEVLGKIKYLKFIVECASSGSPNELGAFSVGSASKLKEVIPEEAFAKVGRIDEVISRAPRIADVRLHNLDRIKDAHESITIGVEATSSGAKLALSESLAAFKKKRATVKKELQEAQDELEKFRGEVKISEKEGELLTLKISVKEKELSSLKAEANLSQTTIETVVSLQKRKTELLTLERELKSLQLPPKTADKDAKIKQKTSDIEQKKGEIQKLESEVKPPEAIDKVAQIQTVEKDIESLKAELAVGKVPHEPQIHLEKTQMEARIKELDEEVKDLQAKILKEKARLKIHEIEKKLEKIEEQIAERVKQQTLIKFHELYSSLSKEQKKIVEKLNTLTSIKAAQEGIEASKIQKLVSSWDKKKGGEEGPAYILEKATEIKPK